MRRRALLARPGLDPRADLVSRRLGALADPVRLRILGLLARGSCPVGPLAQALGIGQSLASFHLAALEEAGLVRLERVGRFTYAELDPAAADQLLEQVRDLVAPGPHGGPQGDRAAQRALQEALDRVGEPFEALLGRDRVERIVREELARLRRARSGRLVDVLVDHARERLRALAQAEGRLPKDVPELLFVCAQNAGRSQMAAALANRRGGGRVHAWSAGSRPADGLPPEVVRAMAEVGIDLSGALPKPLTNDLVRAADVVVTMGCGDDCPWFPRVRYVEWSVPDPAGRSLAEVRRIRDHLDRRVRALIREVAGNGDRPARA